MVMMLELPEVTDPSKRADLARWAVSLRRAYAARTRQVTGQLHERRNFADIVGEPAWAKDSYCCLGIWCVLQLTAGVLQRRPVAGGGPAQAYGPAGKELRDGSWSEGALPLGGFLGGSADPDLLTYICQDEGPSDPNSDLSAWLADGHEVGSWWANEGTTVTAAELNDNVGLNFTQIADVVVWRFGLTDAELRTAELAPRVPEVEGPETPGGPE